MHALPEQACAHVHDEHNGTGETHGQCGDVERSHHGPKDHERGEKCCHERLQVASLAPKSTLGPSVERIVSIIHVTEYVSDDSFLASGIALGPPPTTGLSIARHILYARFLN